MTNSSPSPGDAGVVLSEDAPDVSLSEAAAVLKTLYGIGGDLKVLPSERDHNFRVKADTGGEYVLKFTHPGEPRAVTNFQTMALSHIAAVDPGLLVPAVFPTREGELEPEFRSDSNPVRIVRLLSYLPGRILADAPRSATQDVRLGAFLARLGRALRGFYHGAAGSIDLLWDVRQLPRVQMMVPEIGDVARRALVARALEEAAGLALPVLPSLRAQVTHNDLNPSNVVVAGSDADCIAGVLDFGDMVHGPLVCDVSVGAAYRFSPGEHPLAAAARFIAGYNRVTPLEDAEIAILFDLIRARVAITQAIVNWQASRYPEKREYVMRLDDELWTFLQDMSALSRGAALAYLKARIEET
ncbi:phosphotransferase [soil metagenome]